MSDPKKSMLKTLGRHLFTDDASLEQATPPPPAEVGAPAPAPVEVQPTPAPEIEVDEKPHVEDVEEPPRSSSERFADAQRIAKENAAKREAKRKADAEAAPTPTPDDAAAKAKQEADDAAAKAAKAKADEAKAKPAAAKKKKSEPLPEVKAEDRRSEPQIKPDDNKTAAEHLGFEPDADVTDYLETLRWAEDRDPKFKGAFDKEVARIRSYREFSQKWADENPGEKFDPATAELDDGTTFATVQRKAAPVMDAATQRRMDRERIEEHVTKRATTESNKRIDEIERRQRENEARPQIERRTSVIEKEMLANITIDEDPEIDAALKKLVAEKGVKALADEVPDEGGMISDIIDRTKASVNELLHLRQGIKPFDNANPYHTYLSDVIDRASKFFKASGGADRIRGGLPFVTPEEFSGLNEAARSKYWTFNDDDLTGIITHNAGETIRRDLESKRSAKKKSDEARARFKPKPAASPTGKVTTPVTPPPNSPKIAPSPAGGPSGAAPKPAMSRVASLLLG